MKTDQTIIENYGILTSISWNSNNWADDPSEKDLKTSKYKYVMDNAKMFESLNFGNEKYPVENDGYYIGYTPMFNKPPRKKRSETVEFVFFISSNNHESTDKKRIVGFYRKPKFGEWFFRNEIPKLNGMYDRGNIKALPENIVYFEKPIIINNKEDQKEKFLPKGKEISRQRFNYLNSENVGNILKEALSSNGKNEKLKTIAIELGIIVNPIIVFDNEKDTLEGVRKLEEMMKNKLPKEKHIISRYIERGAIAKKIKQIANYKCSICEKLGNGTNSFIKKNGEMYIEAHHVEPVSTGKIGVLSATNLMTVCANHHRQLHYGNVELLENNEKHFTFHIDRQKIIIEKICLD